MLRRYWLIIYPELPYGPRNFGVSAFSPRQARLLLMEQLRRLRWNHITSDTIEKAEIIEDVDLQLLDQNHVVPNMGCVVFLGVWYPNLNA